MYGNPINHVYIADGFLDDCEQLIQRCLQRQNILDFQSFCIVWQEMNMGCLYQGRTSGAEVAELTEEVLQIAKHYMIANTSNYEESVAGLFLVYSLLNLQPYPGFAALRLVPEDVAAISRLEAVARRERRHDVLYILASVLIKGPCHYHAAERERGMEAPIKKYLDGFNSIDSIRGIRPNGVFYRQNEELDIIRELGNLTKQYSDAKARIIGTGPSDRSLRYIDEELPTELNNSLRNIIGGVVDEASDDSVSDEEEVPEHREDHHTIVEAIKAKAMRNTVNPMKHLTGIEDRKIQIQCKTQQNSNKIDIKSKPGKVKTNSPTKPQACKPPNKRVASPKGNNTKKSKSNPEKEREVERIIKEEKDDNKEDDVNMEEYRVEILPEEKDEISDGNEEDLEQSGEENEVDIEIGSLPSFIRTEDNGQVFEIEIIDKYGRSHTSQEENVDRDIALLASLPDISMSSDDTVGDATLCSDSEENDDDSDNKDFNNILNTKQYPPPNKNLKKTHLKSKFKRLGMLPVANFNE
ncbi:unnamed protein product [Parnassius apollo]|uniref:(apollo) hypothetical protein n=1 Tax=Parnassius apollo TaxID=110799 RepID=A0A8S3XHT8_PARAO|nr:unnamed protein product [Parnassius apollo]